MNRHSATVALLFVFALSGCEQAPTGPSFSQDIVPLMNRHCVMCHMAEGAQGDFSLHPDPYRTMVGVRATQNDQMLVAAGDVAASYLYHKIAGSHLSVGGEGYSMPYERALLSDSDIELVAQWIALGANNN